MIHTAPIPTATICWCGCPITVWPNPLGQWLSRCPNCYDADDDAGDLAHVVGWGETVDESLWAWVDALDEVTVIRVERDPRVPAPVVAELARDVAAETARQRGWISLMELRPGFHEVECYWFGPEAQRAC